MPREAPETLTLQPAAGETLTEREAVSPSQKIIIPDPRQTIAEQLLPGIVRVLLVLFGLGNVTCLGLFWLTGFGITQLSDTALGSLAAATIAEVAGLLAIVLKALV